MGVIGGQKLPSRLSDNGLPYFAAQFGSYGDVLHVWLAGGEAAGSCACLVEAGMQSARFGIDQGKKSIGVGRLQFGDLTILQDKFDYGVSALQFLK